MAAPNRTVPGGVAKVTYKSQRKDRWIVSFLVELGEGFSGVGAITRICKHRHAGAE